jgi:hypothetical protein
MEGYGAECAHQAPVPQATSRHAWAKTHKMATSVADTVTVYNKEADIALPIPWSGFDRTSTEQNNRGQTID